MKQTLAFARIITNGNVTWILNMEGLQKFEKTEVRMLTSIMLTCRKDKTENGSHVRHPVK